MINEQLKIPNCPPTLFVFSTTTKHPHPIGFCRLIFVNSQYENCYLDPIILAK
jgi:hemolysin-activating ACP:hemolysin acyltransferase